MSTTAFGPVATYYDLLMSKVPYDMWVDYYRLLLSSHGQNPGRFLDVCCGTGTVAELLALLDKQVVGIDNSPAMIERARENASRRGLSIRYEVADARDFRLADSFEAAYSFFDSLNYIVTADGLFQAIQTVADHLLPGGSFIFDLNTAHAFESRMFDQQDLRRRASLRYKWVGDYDPGTRLIRVTMDFWAGEEHFQEIHIQRAHEEREVIEMLLDAGLQSVATYNSYTLDPVRAKSDRIHVVALKPS